MMGGTWKSVLSVSIFSMLGLICDSFPYVKQASWDAIHSNSLIDDSTNDHAGRNRGHQNEHRTYEFEQFKAIRTMFQKDSSETENTFTTVRNQAEDAISKFIQTYLANKTDINTTPDGFPVRRIYKRSNSKSSELVYRINNRLSHAKHKSSRVRHSDYTMKSNSRNSRHRSEHERRRSRIDDYILSSGGGDGQVIFGAHTTPCDHADRHYCLNGGTCLYVPALQHKTCRCTPLYAGQRCDVLNHDFLLMAVLYSS